MRLFQYIIVLLNFPPFTLLFRAIYSLGLACLLKSLASHQQILAVFGYGSFFERNCLYGVSDIDLVLVVSPEVPRGSPEYYNILDTYKKVRRFFPFLQHLYELDQNLIFLSETPSPRALPESVRIRLKQGRLYLLHGSNTFQEISAEPVSSNEILSEADGLLRLTLMKDIRHTKSLLFWKKSFKKLLSLCEAAGADGSLDCDGCRLEPAFVEDNDVRLFFRRCDLNSFFEAFLDTYKRLNAEIKSRGPALYLPFSPPRMRPFDPESLPYSMDSPKTSGVSTKFFENLEATWEAIPSTLVGIAPEVDYFPLDQDVPVLRIDRADYRVFLRLKKMVLDHSGPLRDFLLATRDILFVVRKLPTYVDLVPLSPAIFANVYSLLQPNEDGFEMPESIHAEQQEKAKSLITVQAEGYKKNNGWIQKLPFPCLYMEDDFDLIRQALHRMRVFLFHEGGLRFQTSRDLVTLLGDMHPRSRGFLDDLLTYYDELRGLEHAQTDANNLYRCLHEFMGRLLSGEKDIAVDDSSKRLGISVGIITRNRAADLREAMTSLLNQLRPADEILVVDNGSSDDTRKIVEGFADRLPIRYFYLQEPGIPTARNMVIQNARFEIIAFTDDDCIAEPRWLESVERGFLRAENIGIVGGWVEHAAAAKDSLIDRYYRVFHHNTT